ncbi:hypothetical protein BC629DRAFT_1497863 [Irpex lacteus]|nr:hypothetical protein BC629DRAFT_1497863 [Irpex lacteus]
MIQLIAKLYANSMLAVVVHTGITRTSASNVMPVQAGAASDTKFVSVYLRFSPYVTHSQESILRPQSSSGRGPSFIIPIGECDTMVV